MPATISNNNQIQEWNTCMNDYAILTTVHIVGVYFIRTYTSGLCSNALAFANASANAAFAFALALDSFAADAFALAFAFDSSAFAFALAFDSNAFD